MSTRSAVAIPYGDGWKGRYIHYDGYPKGVGANLLRIVQRDGLDKAIQTLVIDNTEWSVVQSWLMESPDFPEFWKEKNFIPGYGVHYETDAGFILSTDEDKWWTDFYYILAANGLWVGCIVGPKNDCLHLGIVPWDTPADEVDWDSITQKAYDAYEAQGGTNVAVR